MIPYFLSTFILAGSWGEARKPFVPKLPKKKIVSPVVWETRKEKRAAIRRSRELHGNYGFSIYVRNLIADDLKK